MINKKAMFLSDEFYKAVVKNIKKGMREFVVSVDIFTYDFISAVRGKAVFYYSADVTGAIHDISEATCLSHSEYRLAAVVANDAPNVVYINAAGNSFCIPDDLPKGACMIYDFKNKIVERFKKRFNDYVDGLEVDKCDPRSGKEYVSMWDIRSEARKRALGFEKSTTAYIPEINVNDALRILSGLISEEDLFEKKLDANKAAILDFASREAAINSLIHDSANDEERRLVKAVYDTDAKLVTVVLEKNGKVSSGKIDPRYLINIITERMSFSWYHFYNEKEGKKVMEELKTDSDSILKESRSTNRVTYENITEIKYKNKTIYCKKGK